jgi:LemA protein
LVIPDFKSYNSVVQRAPGAAAITNSCQDTLVMKTSHVLLGVVVLVLVLGLGVGAVLLSGYNRVIGLDEAVNNQWAQVRNQLQRRYDLIPNVVETVKGTAGQEQKVFLGIAEARKAYFQADTVPGQAAAASQLERALSRLLLLREAYPELKSNEAFMKLQDTLEGTENRLSVERGRYNDTVRELNQYVRRFPGRLYASLAGVGEAEYFEIAPEAETPPKVDFSEPAPNEAKT